MCKQATEDLLQELNKNGYQVSAKKAQLYTPQATYLGYNLQKGKRVLFLGAVGYCRLWILGFAEIAKPLYTSTRGKGEDLAWGKEERKAFEALKAALTTAPALALPNLEKPFQLFVTEVRGIVKGVLTQTLGPWKRPVAYLSKRLDYVAAGWPNCLRAIAATAILTKEALKLTLGQTLQIIAPHAVESVLRSPPDQ